MTAQIIQMADIQPKTARRTYKGQKITLTYVPDTKKWKWEVSFVQVTTWSEEADTMNKGFKAAEKFIDKQISIRG